MARRLPFTAALGALAASALLACTPAEGDLTPVETGNDGGVDAGTYPSPPYGVTVGATIKDYSFTGYVDAKADTSKTETIQLSDFYNPTGDATFPSGSQYGEGKPKPTALLIDISSGWCGPCQNEASSVLPDEYKKLRPLGAEFIVALDDGPMTAIAATTSDLQNWDRVFKVNYPSVIDPEYSFADVVEAQSYPGGLIIDTRTMKICTVAEGEQDPNDPGSGGEGFWQQLQAVATDTTGTACVK